MENTILKPNKERVNPNELQDIVKNSSYPKPRWMINESVKDIEWLVSKVGIDIVYYKKNKHKAAKVSFKRLVSPNEHLTDNINSQLLIDIQNSL